MNIIVDYGLGNLKSLQNALAKAGITAEISHDQEQIAKARFLILPGVGAFRDAISRLEETGIGNLVKAHAAEGKYLMGICLGMQLLYEKSYEYGEYTGLGIIPGNIVKLTQEKKVPHMGWNNLVIEREDPLVKYTKTGDYVYFVHSFYAQSKGTETLAYTMYGEKIPAIVRQGNVIGFQFHPEKSSKVGANIFKALGEIINENNTGN